MTQQGCSSSSLCDHPQNKSDGRDHVCSFSSALHFSSTHCCNISIMRHTQFPVRAYCSPVRIKHMRKEDLYQIVVTVAFLATPARNRLADSAITVFSSNTFALILSHCIKVVSTELLLKGASQYSYQAVKTLPFPMAVCTCSPSGMH